MVITGKRSQGTIQSVEITFNIIDTIQTGDELGVTELADELGHSKSTIHSHLRTLEQRNMIVREHDGYRLSLQILDMARSVRNQVGDYDVIKTEVDRLASKTGEIAQFGVEEHNNITYMYKSTGDIAVETASRVGTQQPIYSTALGKTVLAYLPPEKTKNRIQLIEFKSFTPNTITGSVELYEELEQIAERGYGIDDEENIKGIRCVAAPVLSDETVLGAVSITGPSRRVTDERLHNEYADSVQRAANIIEVNTRFSRKKYNS